MAFDYPKILVAAVSHQWVNSITLSGGPQLSQPAAADLSDGVTGTGAVVLAGSPIFTGTVGAAALALTDSLSLVSGKVIAWNSDVGISRAGAAYILFGNGTDGDDTALVQAASFNATSNFQVNATPGVDAGPFTAITAIQTTGGIVTTLTGTSDERLKTDVAPFERGLEAVIALHPSLYRWNEAGQKKTGFKADQQFAGFIAQDVQRAIPEAIGQEDEYLSLSDRPIIAALVNAVKELAAQVEKLKSAQRQSWFSKIVTRAQKLFKGVQR
ncbi:MAG: tail fiber domain-containing protein [Acidobacteriia bacterium]|nr:tail fiber domain-containing protein [Terriglobia bacterium]